MHALRKQVKAILDQHVPGLYQSFKLRTMDFTDLARDKPIFVIVEGRVPDPRWKTAGDELYRQLHVYLEGGGNVYG
jgi:hypothetical protein